MRSSYFVIVFLLFLASPINARLSAQEGLEEFIERDSAAFIVIQDPAAILQQIQSSVYFQNRHFQKALELLVDDEFSLSSQERLSELEAKWNEICGQLSKIDEVSLIIHSWEDGSWTIPKLSIAIAGPAEPVRRMVELLKEARSSIEQSESNQPDFFSHIAGNQLAGVSMQQTGNLVLLSNAPEKSKELMARLKQSGDERFRSLARNRSYVQVQKLLEKRVKSPQVRGFIAPRNFWRVLTKLVAGDKALMIEPPESLASAGFQVLLQSESKAIDTPDGTYQAVISWDFVLTYTVPASGFGKLIESFEPLAEFPAIPFSVTSLSAVGFDLKARHAAGKEIFEKYQKHLFAPASKDGKSEGMSFEKYFNFSEFGLAGVTDEVGMDPVLGATSGTISLYHTGNPVHWKPAMEIRRVKNQEAMKKLLVNKLQMENKFAPTGQRLIEIPNDHGQLFGRTESGIREHLASRAKSLRESGEEPPKDLAIRDGAPLSNTLLSRQYEYFINDDWMVHCDHNSMQHFLKSAYEEFSPPGTFDLLLDSTRASSGQSSFFKIDYQSSTFYKVENKRNQNSIESLRIKEKFGNGQRTLSKEVWEKLMSEPDEYGLRNEIESNEDAVAAVRQLIVNAFNDTFGTTVRLYSKDGPKMRIFGQVYSLVDE